MSAPHCNGILTAYRFQQDRQVRMENASDFSEPPSDSEFLWVHLDRQESSAREWLRDESGLSPLLCEALLAEETRPRCEVAHGGLLLILRGVNLNPGADPDDMVSPRLWADGRRVISLRKERVLAVADVEKHVENGGSFSDAGELILFLATRLTDRMSPVIDSLEENLDTIE